MTATHARHLICALLLAAPAAAEPDPAAAVRGYYAALAAGDLTGAHAMWAAEAAPGFDLFAAAHAGIGVEARVGAPVEAGGDVSVPVALRVDGGPQAAGCVRLRLPDLAIAAIDLRGGPDAFVAPLPACP